MSTVSLTRYLTHQTRVHDMDVHLFLWTFRYKYDNQCIKGEPICTYLPNVCNLILHRFIPCYVFKHIGQKPNSHVGQRSRFSESKITGNSHCGLGQ